MNILISQRHAKNVYDDWIDILENNYINYFSKFGIYLVPVSNATLDLNRLVNNLNPTGIILSGGDDVNPKLYNGKSNDKLSVSTARDTTEIKLIELAIKNNIPLLGICRGMQLINVFFKGNLIQNIAEIDNNNIHSCPGFHKVKLKNIQHDTSFKRIEQIEVNSYHHTGILENTLGTDLEIFASLDELNLVEGFYHRNYAIAGIQWHPERPNNSENFNDKLIELFLSRKLFWNSKK